VEIQVAFLLGCDAG